MYGYRSKTAADFIATATAAIGYRSSPGVPNDYAVRAGHTAHGAPWSGAFVDVTARESEIYIPSVLNTTAGLSAFTAARRTHSSPAPGDIVFFAFPTSGNFGMGHVGIVAACAGWKLDGSFESIEGNVSGLGKSREIDGVHKMVRYSYDVVCFARPAFSKAKFERRPGLAKIRKTDNSLQVRRPGLDPLIKTDIKFSNIVKGSAGKHYSTSIAIVQQALNITIGLENVPIGYWTPRSRSAFARFQRQVGSIGSQANGDFSMETLSLLGFLSGTFTISP